MFQKILNSLSPKIIITIIILFFLIWIGIYFQWKIVNFIFFLIFVLLIVYPVSSRIPVGAAIVLLVTTVLLMIFKKNDWAETAATWAYYDIIFILAMIISALKNKNLTKNKADF